MRSSDLVMRAPAPRGLVPGRFLRKVILRQCSAALVDLQGERRAAAPARKNSFLRKSSVTLVMNTAQTTNGYQITGFGAVLFSAVAHLRAVQLDGGFAPVSVADADGFGNVEDEDLAVADFAGAGRGGESIDGFFGERVGYDHLDAHFG